MLHKLFTRAILGAAILCGTATLAYAQGDLRSDRATYFTFSKPVALPSGTLPAGKYLFRIADSQTTRSVVQVYTEDGAKLMGMMLTMPAIRNRVSDEPEVRFLEGPENAPPAIATWWYPGMKTGWEFIYPREQAMKLAQSSKQPVLTTAQQVTADEMKTADLVRVTGSEQKAVSGDPAATTPTGQAQRGEIAKPTPPATTRQATPPPPMTPEPTARTPQTTPAPPTPTPAPATPTTPTTPARATTPRSDLPQTASATPLITVIGALALLAGLGFGVWRRRTA
jgi:LPXTG-motif cell wall-anchored protein